MIFFLCIIFATYLIVIPLNHFLLLGTDLLWLNFLAIVGGTVLMIVLDGTISSIVHKNQARLNPFSRFFSVSKRERDFLEKLGIKRLKKMVPDLGKLVKFPKGKIDDPRSPEYIYKYLLESCSGELGHWISAVVGFAYIAVFAFEPIYCLALGFPVAFVNCLLMVMPSLSLRYNRHSLEQIYNRLKKRQQTTNP